jgi:hypothetical protein
VTSQETVAKYLTEDEGNCVIDARTMLADFSNSLREEPEGEQMWAVPLPISRRGPNGSNYTELLRVRQCSAQCRSLRISIRFAHSPKGGCQHRLVAKAR